MRCGSKTGEFMSDDRNDLVTVGVFGHPDEAALAKNQLESIGNRRLSPRPEPWR
jgi:hypothetical protein